MCFFYFIYSFKEWVLVVAAVAWVAWVAAVAAVALVTAVAAVTGDGVAAKEESVLFEDEEDSSWGMDAVGVIG